MSKTGFNPIKEVVDDGLVIGKPVGPWAEEKYNYVGRYCDIFTSSMHNIWDNLIYIDLFSGSGYAKIRDKEKILMTSPLISLSLPQKFTKHIFCDLNEEFITALEFRAKRDFKDSNCKFIIGNSNENIDEIKKSIPSYSKGNTVLSFCFLDPFSIKNLHFSTIRELSEFAIDFLILLPTGMDANRNFSYFIKKDNKTIDNYLENSNWREKFLDNYRSTNSDFVLFIANEFDLKMNELGYLKPESKQQIRSIDKNLPLYHLAFYSKHKRGNQFWKVVKNYSNDQTNLFS